MINVGTYFSYVSDIDNFVRYLPSTVHKNSAIQTFYFIKKNLKLFHL